MKDKDKDEGGVDKLVASLVVPDRNARPTPWTRRRSRRRWPRCSPRQARRRRCDRPARRAGGQGRRQQGPLRPARARPARLRPETRSNGSDFGRGAGLDAGRQAAQGGPGVRRPGSSRSPAARSPSPRWANC